MADLIAVLMAALIQLMGTGSGEELVNIVLAEKIMELQPVPIAAVEAEAEGLGSGGIDELHLGLTDLLLDPLEIDELGLIVSDVTIDKGGQTTLSNITFTAEISESDLTDALRLHTKSLSDATIEINKGILELSGSYPLWGMRIPYRVSGIVEVANDTQLVFVISKSGVGAVSAPAALNRLIEQEINPVYDLADFAARSAKDIKHAKKQLNYDFKLQVEEIELVLGHIIVTGKA